MMDVAHLYSFWYVLFHVHPVFVDVNFPNGTHTCVVES